MPDARRRLTPLLLAAAAALLATPAAHAHAQATGGTAAPTGTEPILATTPHVMLSGEARFSGTFAASDAGRTVSVERFDHLTESWLPVTTAVVGPDGRWAARWLADVPGRLRARATLATTLDTTAGGGVSVSAAPTETALTVYRSHVASWYGPGFYGRRTACDKKMTRTLLGVAHKTLPCGTEVALHHEGESIVVPVVDRGPYVKGRRWDLTAATAKALGFTGTGKLGAVPLPAAPQAQTVSR